MERLSDAARTNQDAIRGTQEEIMDYRRQLQSRTIELETLRGTKDSLERQRMESEDRHHEDLSSLQAGDQHKYLISQGENKQFQFIAPFCLLAFDL